MKKPLTFICRQKFKFILHVFLEILQRYWKLNVLGSMGMPRHAKPLNFCIHLQEKIQLHPHTFKEILQRYTNLLSWVLWAWQVADTQNDSINPLHVSPFPHTFPHVSPKFFPTFFDYSRCFPWCFSQFPTLGLTVISRPQKFFIKLKSRYQDIIWQHWVQDNTNFSKLVIRSIQMSLCFISRWRKIISMMAWLNLRIYSH